MTNSNTQQPMDIQAIGKATIVKGTVQAQAPGQEPRTLTPESIIYSYDRIITGDDGSISIQFNDAGNTQLDLGRASDMVLTEDVFQSGFPTSLEEATADVVQLQEALLTGEFDPTTDLEAPAAGPAAGPENAGGGTTTFKAELDGKQVTPESGAETEGIAFAFAETPAAPPVPEPEIIAAAPLIVEDDGGEEDFFPSAGTFGDSVEETPTAPPVPEPEIIAAAPLFVEDDGGEEDFFPSAGTFGDSVEERGLEEGTDGPNGTLTTVTGDFDDLGIDFGGDSPGFVTFSGGGNPPVTVVLNGSAATSTQIFGEYGTLTVFGDSTWAYQLTDNSIEHDGINLTGADDTVPDNFSFTVFDSDGDSATGVLNITIYDDGPRVLENIVNRVVEEEMMDPEGSTSVGAIMIGNTLDSTTVQAWTLEHNGGTLSIDMLSEYGPGSFSSNWPGNTPYTDIDGDGVQTPNDLHIILLDETDNIVSIDGGDYDDTLFPEHGDGSVNTADPYIFADLPPGTYTLYVGTYYLDPAEAATGQNINFLENSWGTTGPYQVRITGDAAITGTPPDGGYVTSVPSLSDGNPDHNDLSPEDATQPDSTVVTGTLLDEIVDIGADNNHEDSPYTAFQLIDEQARLETLPDLLSQGQAVYYVINGDTLEAWAGEMSPPPPADDGDSEFGEEFFTAARILEGEESEPRLVFTFQLEENGDYTFTLLDQLDHIRPEPGTSDENSDLQQVYYDQDGAEPILGIDVSALIRATDADGDFVEFTPSTVTFTVEDDTPIFTGMSIHRVVEEEELDNDQSVGNPDEIDAPHADFPDTPEDSWYGNGTDQNDQYWVSGSLAALISIGSDEWPDDGGPFSFDLENILNIGAPDWLTSKGEDVEYALSVNGEGVPQLVAYVPSQQLPDDGNGRALVAEQTGDIDPIEGRLVFTLDLTANGDYTFTLIDQIDHEAGEGENHESLDFSSFINVTDYDGDSFNLGDYEPEGPNNQLPDGVETTALVQGPSSHNGLFTITIVDDIPITDPNAQPIEAGVREAALAEYWREAGERPGDSSEGTDNQRPREWPNHDDTDSSRTSGSLTSVVKDGADEDVTFGLWSLNEGVLPALYSKGVLLEYEVTHDLVGNGGMLYAQLVATAEDAVTGEDVTVFTLRVTEDGRWKFDLDDQLDHEDDGTNTRNTSLVSSDTSGNTIYIDHVDFSGMIRVEDFDHDVITLGTDMFTMTITDDIPVLTCNKIQGFVEEDGMSLENERGEGHPDVDNSEGNDTGRHEGPNDDEDWSTKGPGNRTLHKLVQDGADETISFEFLDSTSVITYMEAQGLQSQGRALEYEVQDNALKGYTTKTNEDGSTTQLAVFTLHINHHNQSGNWYFDLDDQLDHNFWEHNGITGGYGENTWLQSHPPEGSDDPVTTSTRIDFSGTIRAVDKDGDQVTLKDGQFTMKVQDDVPVLTDPTGFSIIYNDERAGYDNIIGTYELDESGKPTNLQIVMNSSDGYSEHLGDELTFSSSHSEDVKLFIIADGASNLGDLTGKPLTFGENTDGKPTLLVDGVDYAATYNKGVYFMDSNLNVDNEDHFKLYDNGSVGVSIHNLAHPGLGDNDIGVEDLAGTNVYGENSDHDYNDTILELVPGFGVRESALEADGSLPSETARIVQGNFLDDGNISVGADEPATIAIKFNDEWHTITLDGSDVQDLVVGGSVAGDDQETAGQLTIDSNGNWTYELVDNTLTHTDTVWDDDGDRELADFVTDHFDIWVRDFDYDWAHMNLNVNIYDDGPHIELIADNGILAHVDEDALNNTEEPDPQTTPVTTLGGNSDDNDNSMGNLDPANNTDTDSLSFGDLNDLITPVYGADGAHDTHSSPSFTVTQFGPNGQASGYYSDGTQILLFNAGPGTIVGKAAGEVIFTFSVGADGTGGTFDLTGQMDHVAPVQDDVRVGALLIDDDPDESTTLVYTEDDENGANAINLGQYINVTIMDGDGDSTSTTLDGLVEVEVENDVPIAVDDVGSMFGWSSYRDSGDEPPAELFDVLGNDVVGADETIQLQNVSFRDGGGSAEIEDGQIKFTPGSGENSFSGQSVVEYTIADADGNTDTATLTINERYLKVGNNVEGQEVDDNDVVQDSMSYAVGDGTGTIEGGVASDILIGDYGGQTTTVDAGDANLLFILDSSGSMSGSKIAELKASMTSVLNKINSGQILGDATNVRIHMVTFNNGSSNLGTYDIKGSGAGTVGTLSAALTWFDTLTTNPEIGAGGYTNYEAGMQEGISWIGKEESDGGPLDQTDIANQALLLTDGDPNRWTGDPLNAQNNTQEAMKQIFGESETVIPGIQPPLTPDMTIIHDDNNEVQTLSDWGELRAVGVLIPEGSNSDGRLDRIDETGDAINTTPGSAQMEAAIIEAITTTETHLSAAGNDQIEGGDGDDLVFGDVLYTDGVFEDLGIDGSGYGLEQGSGFAIFKALEDDINIAWTRTDTIDYILNNAAGLGQETTRLDGEGRLGGTDILHGMDGNDVIFGQEGSEDLASSLSGEHITGGDGDDWIDGGSGSEFIAGGEGNDQLVGGGGSDIILGGEGDDRIVGDEVAYSSPAVISEDGSIDNITGDGGTDTVFNEGNGETITDSYVAGTDLDTLIPPPEVA